MINNAQFQIIGRIGKINAGEKVTHISIASDRKVKDKDGNWSTEANWNRITVFSPSLRKYLASEAVGKVGNKLIVQGTIQSGAYEKNGIKTNTVDLIAQDIDVLAFAKDPQ